jgi:hypothetical protein
MKLLCADEQYWRDMGGKGTSKLWRRFIGRMIRKARREHKIGVHVGYYWDWDEQMGRARCANPLQSEMLVKFLARTLPKPITTQNPDSTFTHTIKF